MHVLITLKEGVGNLLTFGSVAKAQRYLSQAETRLAEAKALADKGDTDLAEKATEAYEDTLAKAEEKANGVAIAGDKDALLEHIAAARAKHITVLEQVLQKVPDQAKAAIQDVINRAEKRIASSTPGVGPIEPVAPNDSRTPKTPPSANR